MNKIFKNKYNEIRSGWSILIGIVFFLAFDIIAGLLIKDFERNIRTTLIFIVGIIISFGLILILKLIYKKPLYEMGFSKVNSFRNMFYGLLFGFISISIIFLSMIITNNIKIVSINFMNVFTPTILFSLLLSIKTGIFEETLSRSYIMTSLKTTRSKLAIILVSSIIFSVLHGANPGMGIIPFINIVLAGLLFGYLFIKSGSVWLSIGYHIAWNFFEGSFYGFLLSGSKATETVVKLDVVGKDFVTGGNFGPEGGIFISILLVLSFVWIHYFVKTPKVKEIWRLSDNESN